MDGRGVDTNHGTVTARSLPVMGSWFIVFAIALTGFFMLPADGPGRVLAGLLALFCGQALVAEWIGFRCDGRGLSYPRRIFPSFSFPTIWRRQISVRKISRMDALGERAILFYLSSTERAAVVFPDNRSRRLSMRLLSEAVETRRLSRRQTSAERTYEARQY